jgi:hypothetical protein
MSEQRACKAIGCCRMTVRYKATRADDADLRQRVRAIAEVRRRFGYRRLDVLLKREGYLQWGPGRRCPTTDGRSTWDQLTDGRRFRILTSLSGTRVTRELARQAQNVY